MKKYHPTHPTPENDHRAEWKLRPLFSASEDKHGEGARPSSPTPVHRPAVIDPLHEINLLRMMQVANEHTLRELGPLPPGGLSVQKKSKPKTPYTDFRGRIVSAEPTIKENDEMKLKRIAIAALATGIVTHDLAIPAVAAATPAGAEPIVQTHGATPTDVPEAQDEPMDIPASSWQMQPEFQESFKAKWRVARTDEEKLAIINEEMRYQDKMLNARYQELRAILPDKRWELLQREQREWLDEDSTRCTSDVIVIGQVDAAYCRLYQTALRAYQLDVMIALKRNHH